MAKFEQKKAVQAAKVEEKKPSLTAPDKKVNTVAEAAAKIKGGEKVGHPGPWVDIKPREGFTLEQELIKLQEEKRLIGYNPKTGKGILK